MSERKKSQNWNSGVLWYTESFVWQWLALCKHLWQGLTGTDIWLTPIFELQKLFSLTFKLKNKNNKKNNLTCKTSEFLGRVPCVCPAGSFPLQKVQHWGYIGFVLLSCLCDFIGWNVGIPWKTFWHQNDFISMIALASCVKPRIKETDVSLHKKFIANTVLVISLRFLLICQLKGHLGKHRSLCPSVGSYDFFS